MNFIAFDIETTGFIPGVDRIVELGAVRFINGTVDGVFATLVDPQMAIPYQASQVNGITNEMVVGKPKVAELLDPFAEFCGELTMVAHNAPFDYQFIAEDIKRNESRAPRGVVLDTLNLSRKVFPGLPNYKLGTLIQHLNIPASEFHRAEQDASYCGQLFQIILQRMAGQNGPDPELDILANISGKGLVRFPQLIPQPKQLGLF